MRLYRIQKPDKIERNFFSALLNCLPEDVICIYDAQDDDGEWVEEIHNEAEVGLPKKESECLTADLDEHYFMTYWVIKIPGVDKSYISRDSSPFGIYLNKKDVGKLHFENFYNI